MLRERSLITGRRWAKKWGGGGGGGASQVLLLQEKGVGVGRETFNLTKGGGGTKLFGVDLTQVLEVLAILKARHKRGGGATSFGPAIFPFCSPRLPCN